MGTNRSWNWKLSVLKTVKVMLVRPLMTNFKVTVRADCAVSECSPLSQPTKALSNPLIVSGGSHPSDRCLPSPTGCQNPNKANFPFHQPGLLIGFWAAGLHCGLRHLQKSWCWKLRLQHIKFEGETHSFHSSCYFWACLTDFSCSPRLLILVCLRAYSLIFFSSLSTFTPLVASFKLWL